MKAMVTPVYSIISPDLLKLTKSILSPLFAGMSPPGATSLSFPEGVVTRHIEDDRFFI